MIDQIDVKLLTAAIAVARELDYSRAAKKLNISRAELTRQIAELESRLCLAIFLVKGRNMEITDVGKQFITASCRFLKVREVYRTLPAETSMIETKLISEWRPPADRIRRKLGKSSRNTKL